MKPVGYRVEIRVNDVAVQGLKIERKHELGQTDDSHLSAHTILSLKKGDKIKAYLIPVVDALEIPDRNKVKYKIKEGEAQLNIKLERRF